MVAPGLWKVSGPQGFPFAHKPIKALPKEAHYVLLPPVVIQLHALVLGVLAGERPWKGSDLHGRRLPSHDQLSKAQALCLDLGHL